jgi:indole-3-glycerol phosphate synthase
MHGVLDRIIETKRREVEAGRGRVSIDEFKAQVRDLPRTRNFFSALSHDPTLNIRNPKILNVIAEVKKASPSAGVIKGDFDPVQIAKAYAAAGADALSVLTDEPYFQGKLEYLAAVKREVELPILRKDFIVDPWQIYESRVAGADAILLIAEVLHTHELIDLQILATELNLTTLIEVHTIENLMRVRDSVIGFPHKSYSLLGINNRDLQSFKSDVATTLRMLDLVEDRTVLVSESGIATREHTEKLAKNGVRTVLVGETLMRAGDVAGTMKQLFAI